MRQAPNVEEKYCGLQSLAAIIEDPARTLEEILSANIIKVAAPLLIDGITSVRNSAAGALNNLSHQGYEVCVAMIEQDVMTPLIAYFEECAPKLAPQLNSKKFDEETESFTNCISLLLNLCENSGRALKYFNMSSILPIIMRFLDFESFGYEICISVLQFLFVVTEDNIGTTDRIKRECEGKLKSLLQLEGIEPAVLLSKTLGAGVIINCCGGDIASLPAETINRIMCILSSTLSEDHRNACNQLSSAIPVSNGRSKVKTLKGKEGQALENQIKSVRQLLSAQQTSTEIIANIFSSEDGDDSMESDDSSDSEEMAEENISQCGNDESLPLLDKLPPEVSEAMASYEIFDKVWSKSVLPPDNTMQILREYESSSNLCQVAANLQSRSLLCVNNMVSSLPLPSLGGASGLRKTWVAAGKLVFAPSGGAEPTLVESATAVVRSTLCRLKAEGDGGADVMSGIRDLSPSDVELMLAGAKACALVEARANLIRAAGALALLLTRSPAPPAADVVALVTGFLLDQAHKESEVWVVAECVDTLLDLYAEDETDALAARTHLVDRLAHIAPVLKNKARQQRKQLGEHAILVHTATSNLPRFIRYKRDRIAQLSRQ